MAYQYQQSPLFYSASYITALDHYSMSRAVNDRVRYGPADCSRRIQQYFLSAFRQVRSPSEPIGLPGTEQWPALGEWSEIYSYFPRDEKWPDAAPGEYEGTNPASQTMAFVLGNPQIPNEGARINETASATLPASPATLWEAAKIQRGGIDPITGQSAAPFYEGAQSHFRLTQPRWSFHGKSYGGVQPVPEANSICNDDEGNAWLNQNLKFRAVLDGSIIENISAGGTLGPYQSGSLVEFNGTCGPNAGGSYTDVAFWNETAPFAYFLYLFNGTVYRIDKSDWLMVKDGGGLLQRQQNDALHRLLMNAYLKEFRGTENQRSGSCYDLMGVAFDYNHFFSSQFQLAPAYAQVSGDELEVTYPSHTFTGHIPPFGGTPVWTMHDGFRLGGYLISSQNVSVPYTVLRYENNVLTGETLISPNTSSLVITLPTGSVGTVQFKIWNRLDLPVNSSITIEISELMDYAPEIFDAYHFLRLASSNGQGDMGEDVQGIDEDQAARISTYYKESGACVNVNGSTAVGEQELYPNSNPVYEAARKQILEWSRAMNRNQLVGYAVSGGKSILYLRRYLMVDQVQTSFDCFEGIINTANTSSNGIRTVAPTASYTNEWVMDMSFQMYGGNMNNDESTSTWKPSVYGDYFPMIQRCQLMNEYIRATSTNTGDMFGHFQQVASSMQASFAYGDRLYAPEALSAYNYMKGVNPNAPGLTSDEKLNFYKSCQIYPDPYTIESATVDAAMTALHGFQVVKLVFSGRFQYHADAPASVSSDMTTWDAAALKAHSYQTDERALMLYLLVKNGLTTEGDIVPIIGDCAASAIFNFRLGAYDSDVRASLIPHFFFTKLIPSPYLLDVGVGPGKIPSGWLTNEASMSYLARHPDNTLIHADRFIQMETYLRAISEGYVNTEIGVNCDSPLLGIVSHAYDYTWEDLNYAAHGGKWFSMMPATLRADLPINYGPLPTVDIFAEPLRNLSKVMNKLTKVRVPLPYQLLCKTYYYTGSAVFAPSQGSNRDCTLTGRVRAAEFGWQPPSANDLVSVTDWQECNGLFSNVITARDTSQCNGTSFVMVTARYKQDFKFDAVDPDALYAMNTDLRSLYQGTGNSFYGRVNETKHSICHRNNPNQMETPCDCLEHEECVDSLYGTNFFWWNWNNDNTFPMFDRCSDNYDRESCGVFDDGAIDVGATPPAGDIFIGQEPNARYPAPLNCDTFSLLSKTVDIISNGEVIVKIPLV